MSGLPIIRLSKRDTRGSSVACPRCGERLQSDKWLRRKLWCSNCRTVMDRDVAAAVNLSREGTVEVRPFPAQVLGARASK